MPEKETLKRAQRDKRQGKSASTQAGEFVREEIEHVREGKHGARSTEQAIAIGLSKARRAGVELPPPEKGTVSKKTRRRAKRDYEVGQGKKKPAKRVSKKRSKAVKKALKRMPHRAASKKALSKHAKKAARERSASERSAAARKAARTRAKKRR